MCPLHVPRGQDVALRSRARLRTLVEKFARHAFEPAWTRLMASTRCDEPARVQLIVVATNRAPCQNATDSLPFMRTENAATLRPSSGTRGGLEDSVTRRSRYLSLAHSVILHTSFSFEQSRDQTELRRGHPLYEA